MHALEEAAWATALLRFLFVGEQRGQEALVGECPADGF